MVCVNENRHSVDRRLAKNTGDVARIALASSALQVIADINVVAACSAPFAGAGLPNSSWSRMRKTLRTSSFFRHSLATPWPSKGRSLGLCYSNFLVPRGKHFRFAFGRKTGAQLR